MEQLQSYDDWKVYRFQCDCMSPGCCLDLEITVDKDARASIQFLISDPATASLWKRIKTAFKYLFGRDSLPQAEICLRKDDEEELIKILKQQRWEDVHVQKDETN